MVSRVKDLMDGLRTKTPTFEISKQKPWGRIWLGQFYWYQKALNFGLSEEWGLWDKSIYGISDIS